MLKPNFEKADGLGISPSFTFFREQKAQEWKFAVKKRRFSAHLQILEF